VASSGGIALLKKDRIISFHGINLNELVLHIPHAKRLGLRFIEKRGDNLVIEMPYSPELEVIPDTGLMANGAITAFLDTALGAAVSDQFEVFRRIATLDLRVDYFDKPRPHSAVRVKTRCLKVTDQIVFVQGDAYCEDESVPIAHAVAAFSHTELLLPGKDAPETKSDVGQIS